MHKRAAKSRLPLKKKGLQLELLSVPAFPFGLRVSSLPLLGMRKEFRGSWAGKTQPMGYGKPPPANVYLYFVSSDSSEH